MRIFRSLIILICLLLATSTAPGASIIHPEFPMLDRNGTQVLKSRQPVSTRMTCGSCHDTEYIERHNFHSTLGLKELGHPRENFKGYPWELSTGLFGKWNPILYRRLTAVEEETIDLGTVDWLQMFGRYHAGGGPAEFSRDGSSLLELSDTDPQNPEASVFDKKTGERVGWNWKESGVIETSCFLCHLPEPDNEARIKEIQRGKFKWVNTAILGKTGIVSRSGTDWIWNKNAFSENGNLRRKFITIEQPGVKNCMLCHTMADPASVKESTGKVDESLTGVVFAPDLISESGVNVKGKQELDRSWDIHSERLMDCTGCHFSINNPAFYKESDRTRPTHLKLDGRKTTIAEFLHRPNHKLANMRIRFEIEYSEPDNVIHRCDACHDPYTGHDFLPYKKRHIWALGCESCHIPRLFTPALQSLDWTVLTREGQPIREFRGVSENQVSGYEPSWLTRNLADKSCLLPYNLVTSLYWAEGEGGKPVKQALLEKVFLEDSSYHQNIIRALDEDGDGQLDDQELRLDTQEKVNFISQQLSEAGVSNPVIESEIRPVEIHHGVTGRKGAIRNCYDCHGSQSRFTREMKLASFIPENVTPKLAPASLAKLEGNIERSGDGSLVFQPRPKERGLYLLGRYRNTWVDVIGILSLLGVLIGITLHGGARIITSRKIKHEQEFFERVYMYPVYERLWHWLQAATITIFIFTGLEIRFAEKFPLFGYETAVRIHEIVAFVFLANAFMSFAYHVTAGEIKTYLPQPKSFIDESWRQALYYLKGIFIGARHPIEKTPERRLNPIQQVTYLAILYALIPIQATTGILIWGAEIWPEFLEQLGGLNMIAPIHTLCAWFFVSFLVMHIYLTTTGHTPMANIKAMITGWDDVELKNK